ncbi:MAG: PepSY-like domain-containing protein [Duncaniella sp.]|nr:PepSY-like domain-containing protein [Duncaniella sp.]
MKRKTILLFSALMTMLAAPAALAQLPMFYTTPGIVTEASQSDSQLPSSATRFIDKHFRGIDIDKCERYFAKDRFEVELNNGIDIEFDSNGTVTEIDAPSGATLAPALIKDLVPVKTFRHLAQNNMLSQVESISYRHGKFYEVELDAPAADVVIFDLKGNFVKFED